MTARIRRVSLAARATRLVLVCCALLSCHGRAIGQSPEPAQSRLDAPNSGQPVRADDERLEHAMRLAPRAIRGAVDRVRPALVTIESFGGVTTTRGRIGGIRNQGEGSTTGIMISPDGFVVTSLFSFLGHPSAVTVVTSDGQRRVARLVGQDLTRQIGLLKIDGDTEFPVPEFVPLSQIRTGQWAISVGIGYGDTEPAVSIGIISATGRIAGRAIQTDANISPANYGGPLVDVEGRVLGVCVPLSPHDDSTGAGVEWYDSGIGFAIPLADAEELIERLKRGEILKPALLGVTVEPSNDPVGVRVTSLVDDSAASKIGLAVGDVITAIDNQPTRQQRDLQLAVRRYVAGDQVGVDYLRDGESQSIDVVLGERSPTPANSPQPPGSDKQPRP
jgi:serine protease Do